MNVCLTVVESTISHYTAAVEKDNVNFNKIILTMKNTKLYVPVVTLTAKDNLTKGFEKSVYWNKHKTKSKSKNTTNEFINFLEWNFVGVKRLFALVRSNRDNNVRRFKGQKYYLRKCVIKNYNVITNGKNICDNWYNTIWKNKINNNRARWRLCWTTKKWWWWKCWQQTIYVCRNVFRKNQRNEIKIHSRKCNSLTKSGELRRSKS